MLHYMWFIMMASGMLWGVLQDNGGELLNAALEGCGKAIGVTLELGAGYMFFCGLMKIASALKTGENIGRIFAPALGSLMRNVRTSGAREAASMNIAMNMLGMGNAATPMGLEAMRRMEAEREKHPGIKHDMEMLLILNATGLQLVPTTVLAMRAAAGSTKVGAVLWPTIACTAFSTFVGVLAGLICRKTLEGKND